MRYNQHRFEMFVCLRKSKTKWSIPNIAIFVLFGIRWRFFYPLNLCSVVLFKWFFWFTETRNENWHFIATKESINALLTFSKIDIFLVLCKKKESSSTFSCQKKKRLNHWKMQCSHFFFVCHPLRSSAIVDNWRRGTSSEEPKAQQAVRRRTAHFPDQHVFFLNTVLYLLWSTDCWTNAK